MMAGATARPAGAATIMDTPTDLQPAVFDILPDLKQTR
jgi:hypothetical protein